jgi:hypothetical protein
MPSRSRGNPTPHGLHAMTKERQSNKETKKKPNLTLKEKRNAKKNKQEPKGLLESGKGARG